jgi:hypothetical protein
VNGKRFPQRRPAWGPAIQSLALALLVAAGCTAWSAGRHSGLPVDELRVIESFLLDEYRDIASRRPVLILATTDSTVPEDFELDPGPKPDGMSDEAWRDFVEHLALSEPPTPPGLRQVNREIHSLAALRLAPGFRLHGSPEFHRAYGSERRFLRMVADLGGREPLVLAFSRPWIAPGGEEAYLVEHVHSTWSGCGGINIYRFTRTGDSWIPELVRVASFW